MKIEYLSLEDVCERIVDCPHESPEWRDQGIHVIRNFNLVDGQIDLSDSYYVDEETYRKRIQRAVPQAGDIIFSREAPIGNCAIIPDGFKCCLGQRLVLMRVNKAICSSEYLLAALMSDYVKCQIDQVSRSGSIVSNFNIGDLKKLVIPVVENMESVAKTSALLNAKLSLNKQLCSQLESMAKTLYDYWFVQFDFPDANGKPYRASGGEMVWNEQLKREIPKGWEVRKISDVCETRLGGTPDTSNAAYWNGDIPWLNSGEIAQSPILASEKSITEEGRINSTTAFAKAGAVLLSITRYIRPAILSIDACFNQSVVAVVPNSLYKTEYIYQLLLSQVDRYMVLRTGAQQPHINKDIVDNTLVICPPESVLVAYYEETDSIRKLQLNKAREKQELIQLRDWLLPMLMNGQATVAPAESAPKLQVLQPEKPARDPRFDRWLQTQGVAARGAVDMQTLHDIFDAMDDDDKH